MDMLKSKRAEELTKYNNLLPHGVYDTVEELEKYCHGDMEDPVYMRATILVSVCVDYDDMVPFYGRCSLFISCDLGCNQFACY